MRVSWAYRFDAATAALERLQTQLLQHQQRLATGQRLQQLGDDPAALARVLRMDELIAQTQRQRDTLALLQQELQALQLHTEGLSDALAEIAVLLQEALDAKNLDKPALIAERLHQRLEDLVARQRRIRRTLPLCRNATRSSLPPAAHNSNGGEPLRIAGHLCGESAGADGAAHRWRLGGALHPRR
jgi:hypothetical protein